MMQSFSKSQFYGTATSSSSTFNFGAVSLRQAKDAMMVVLDDDGLSLVSSHHQTNAAAAEPQLSACLLSNQHYSCAY